MRSCQYILSVGKIDVYSVLHFPKKLRILRFFLEPARIMNVYVMSYIYVLVHCTFYPVSNMYVRITARWPAILTSGDLRSSLGCVVSLHVYFRFVATIRFDLIPPEPNQTVSFSLSDKTTEPNGRKILLLVYAFESNRPVWTLAPEARRFRTAEK